MVIHNVRHVQLEHTQHKQVLLCVTHVLRVVNVHKQINHLYSVVQELTHPLLVHVVHHVHRIRTRLAMVKSLVMHVPLVINVRNQINHHALVHEDLTVMEL